MVPKPANEYHAYLLRLWREEKSRPWRAELVSPQTGEKHRFASAAQLLYFLATLTGEEEGSGDQES